MRAASAHHRPQQIRARLLELLARPARHLQPGIAWRESEILALLVDGLDQARIAEELVISPKTVATHIQRILAKLGVKSRAQAVAFAVRNGLVPPADAGLARSGSPPVP